MKKHEHIVKSLMPGGIGEELGIEPGDKLLAINGNEIQDVFDYYYYEESEQLLLLIEKPDGEEWELEIEKDYEEDLGIEFEQGLMDEYRSCRNKCMFCCCICYNWMCRWIHTREFNSNQFSST